MSFLVSIAPAVVMLAVFIGVVVYALIKVDGKAPRCTGNCDQGRACDCCGAKK